MILLYNVLLVLLAPLWWPWMAWRAAKRGERPNARERRGDYRDAIPEKAERPRVWLHAVSVGEVVAAQPLLRELRRVLPDHEIVLSVTTSSGHRTAREAKERLYDHLVYLPIDLAPFVRRAMRRVRPDALVVMETELWPNLLRAAKAVGARTFVANARLSDRSFPRARRLARFYRDLFRFVDLVLAQSEADASRFRELGAASVETIGNVKFDQALDALDDATDWRGELGLDERPVVVVGSLRAEEFHDFAPVLAKNPSLQWVVAPRHIERTPELVIAIRSLGTASTYGLRSKREVADVIVLDTYGELARVYAVADVAVVGGSFEKLGGQNIIQPLAYGKPVLHGAHMGNFRDVAALADRAGASISGFDADDLMTILEGLFEDPARLARMGEAAHRLVVENRGASARMAQAVASELARRKREQAPALSK